MTNIKLICLCLTLMIICMNEALRILVVFPAPSKSHSILGRAVANHLLAAGHEVVHVTPYPQGKVEDKLKEIDLTHIAQYFMSATEKTEVFKLKNRVGKGNVYQNHSIKMFYFLYELHKKILTEQVFKDFLKDRNEKFDIVIVEWFFYDLLAGISSLFECPLIWFGTTETHWQILRLIDEVPNPSYNVDILSSNKPPLDFWRRVEELWNLVKRYTLYTVLFTPLEKSLYNSVFSDIATKRGITMPAYNDVVYNASFLFINSHPSIGAAYRLPQNAKYIGGYHVDTKVKPLPKELQRIMDEAKHGVIYFSMGSNLKSKDMSDNMKRSILKMFSALKQKIIWKFEEDLTDIPNNVHLVKWAPQQSILAHPNLKIFITHGGQLSTIEAIHYAVPVIGIPVVADQHVNMKSVTAKGFGVCIDLEENMSESLDTAIKEVLNNRSYTIRAKELSQLYHDRSNPGEELVYWVEHVVRTKGALHLRSPALLLPFYKRLYLDLAAVILAVLGSSLFIIQKLISSLKSNKTIITKQKKTK